jgi:hypothetical protein
MRRVQHTARELYNATGERLCEERWTLIDALYFVMTTVSTVGYGDFIPTSAPTHLFTMCYIAVGVPWMFLLMCSLLQKACHSCCTTSISMARVVHKRLASRANRAYRNSINGPRFEVVEASSPAFFVRHKLLPFALREYLQFMDMVLNCCFGLVLLQAQPAWKAFFVARHGPTLGYFMALLSSIFHCAVTGTTIGYNSGPGAFPGFRQPGAQLARFLATLHILCSVAWLSLLFDQLGTLVSRYMAKCKQAKMLERECDASLITGLAVNGKSVPKFEYVCGCSKCSAQSSLGSSTDSSNALNFSTTQKTAAG